MRWEYHRVTNWKPTKSELDELGNDGWELIGFTRMNEFIFKRPALEKPQDIAYPKFY